jgi:hypothetical protein
MRPVKGVSMNADEVLSMAEDRFERRLTEESSAIRQEIGSLRREMATRDELAAVRQEMATKAELNDLRQEMQARFAQLDHQITDARVDMIKWTFVFWTGQCLVFVGLVLALFRNH